MNEDEITESPGEAESTVDAPTITIRDVDMTSAHIDSSWGRWSCYVGATGTVWVQGLSSSSTGDWGWSGDWGQIRYTYEVEDETEAEDETEIDEARERADRLLQEGLSRRQRRELRRARRFTVYNRRSRRRYRIIAGMGKHGNIEEIDADGSVVNEICAAPAGALPEGDYLLAQKLHLELNEEEFRQAANITPVRRAA